MALKRLSQASQAEKELYVCRLAFEMKSLYFLLVVPNNLSEFDDMSIFDDETVLHMRPLAATFDS